MERILYGADGRLRNGWWILVFVAVFLVSRVLYRPAADGLRLLGATDAGLEPLRVLFALLVTWACVRMRRQTLASVGLGLDRRWLMHAALGLLGGAVAALLAVALMWAAGGVRLQLDPARSVEAVAIGFYVFAAVSLLEELLFRGFVFQRMVDGMGFWAAQATMALLFAASHWGNPDMLGEAKLIGTIEIALGAIQLGLAWRLTRSLALPVGLHLGWNWMQGQILGFDVSGLDQPGWFAPQLQDAPTWLTGGAFGLEASVCAIAIDLLTIGLLWHWSRPAATPRVTESVRPRSLPDMAQ